MRQWPTISIPLPTSPNWSTLSSRGDIPPVQRILSESNWWNRLLPITLILAGAGITALVLAADLLNFGGSQGIGPRQASLALSGFAIFLAGVILISSVSQRYISEWLLVGLATI